MFWPFKELTKHLTLVYSALIAEIEKYGGSIIAFAGDAMLCWFDEAHGPASARAAVCAFAMQDAMRAFASINVGKDMVALTLKVAIAGATVSRTSTAEHHAEKGDVILDEATVNALGIALTIKEWREDEESKERFAVLSGDEGLGTGVADPRTLTPVLPASLRPPTANKLMPWMPHAVYEREHFAESRYTIGLIFI